MEKIKGIVLRLVKYNDKRVIVDMYTDSHGRMACVMPVKCRLVPLSIVDLEVDYHPAKSMQSITRLDAISATTVLQDLRFNPVKAAIALFLAEFLYNILREEAANQQLFSYLEVSIQLLDRYPGNVANFHITFLIRLMRFIGIQPNLEDGNPASYFDLEDGCYTSLMPVHPHFLIPEEARILPWLTHINFENMHLYRFSHTQRDRCLEVLTEYYRIHLSTFGQIRSLEVMKELFGK